MQSLHITTYVIGARCWRVSAALEQLQAQYAEWAASAAALAQQLPDAIVASAPQQAPAVQVETSTQQLHLL